MGPKSGQIQRFPESSPRRKAHQAASAEAKNKGLASPRREEKTAPATRNPEAHAAFRTVYWLAAGRASSTSITGMSETTG